MYLQEGEISKLHLNEIKQFETQIKGEANPVQDWTFPEFSRSLRHPDFRTDS